MKILVFAIRAYLLCNILCSVSYRISSAKTVVKQQPLVSPFELQQNKVPSYLMDIYNEVSGPRKTTCHDRTYVSIVNSVRETSSICSPGEIFFALPQEEKNDHFLHSVRVYIELMSILKEDQVPTRKVVVALSFKNSDTLLGYMEIETGRYESIDITEESRRWWKNGDFESPEININFYASSAENLKNSCDIFWRGSILISLQNNSYCKKNVRRPRYKPQSPLPQKSSMESDYSEGEEERGWIEEEFLSTLRDLKVSLEKMTSRVRVKRSAASRPQNETDGDVLMENQKELFLKATSEAKIVKEEIPVDSFSKIVPRYILASKKTAVEGESSDETDNSKNMTNSWRLGHSGMPQKRELKTKNDNSRCNLKRKLVNFAKLKLDWILAPTEYQSGRCVGKCRFPLDPLSNPTGYAILSSIQRHMTGRGNYPSCIPTTMESITLLMRGNDGLHVIQNVDDMVVKSCGCR